MFNKFNLVSATLQIFGLYIEAPCNLWRRNF